MRFSPRIFQAISSSLLALALGLLVTGVAQAQAPPVRGDANSDTKVDISDPIFVLNYLFSGGEKPQCIPTADANADSRVDISDAVAALTYLFAGQAELPGLTAEEIASCLPPPKVLRLGRLIDVLEPGHGIDGKVEELENRVIRIRNFSYDGKGDPQVVVLLTKVRFANMGIIISPDLRRALPYDSELLEFTLPDDAASEDFEYVSIWCDALPLTFGYARLVSSG